MPLIDLLPSEATLMQVLPGHVIFSQGERGGVMYVVVEGEAQILLGGKAVETVRSGGIVGEMALIDAGPRSATAIAKTRCVLVAIDEARFRDLVGRRPEFALEVMRVLVHRLRRMDVER
jgi:CRP-like cAMP-binding protein